MSFSSTGARIFGWLALCLLQPAWAQSQPADRQATSQSAPLAGTGSSLHARSALADAAPQRLEQAWDVIEAMGKPVAGGERAARIVLRGQGALLVDGGCNRFSGRYEHDAQGQFRVSKYSGTHDACSNPPRSEAVLNSALVLVNNYRWDHGLVLRSGDSDLLRLQPSANQDSQDIEQALVRHPAVAPVQAAAAAEPACGPVKAAKSRHGKAKHGKAKAKSRSKLKAHAKGQVCKPTKATAKAMGKAKAKAGAKARGAVGKSRHSALRGKAARSRLAKARTKGRKARSRR